MLNTMLSPFSLSLSKEEHKSHKSIVLQLKRPEPHTTAQAVTDSNGGQIENHNNSDQQ